MVCSSRLSALAVLFFAANFVATPAQGQDAPATISEGDQVSFTYTLSSGDEIIESNANDPEPMVYTQGGGQILPALEAELAGLSAGDQKTVSLSAADGYGDVRPEALQEVPLDTLPEDARVEGALLQATGFPGPIRVAEIKDETAVLDFNHPLAGKPLTFDITIVAVQDAAPPPAPPTLGPAN